MKRLILLLVLLVSGITYLAGQRLNHHPRINIENQTEYAKNVYQHLKKELPSPSPRELSRSSLRKKHKPLAILKTSKEIDDPWRWLIFSLFFICLLSTVIAITLGFTAPYSILLLIFVIVAAVTFAAGMITLLIVLANQAPDPPPSLLEK